MGRKRRAGQTGGSLRGHLMVRDAELRSAPHHEVDQAHRERSPLILRSRASFDSHPHPEEPASFDRHPHPEEPAKRASRRMRVTAQDEERASRRMRVTAQDEGTRLEGWGGLLLRDAPYGRSSG